MIHNLELDGKFGIIPYGNYINGKKDGIGTYLWEDKTLYQGEWKENLSF